MSDSDQRKFANTLNEHVSGCAAAHQRLLGALENLTDGDCRQDSLLPNWSRGHVLTHLSRNADSHVNLLQAAVRGEVGNQYVSVEQRNGDIESGATRSAEELVMDLRLSIYGLEAAWPSQKVVTSQTPMLCATRSTNATRQRSFSPAHTHSVPSNAIIE